MKTNHDRVTALFDQLQHQTDAFLKVLQDLDEHRLELCPEEGSWSLREVAQHLFLVEERVLTSIRERPERQQVRRSLKDRVSGLMLGMIFTLGLRVKSPAKAVLPTKTLSLTEIETRWRDVRAEFRELILARDAGELQQMLFRHPVMGPLDCHDGVGFVVDHFAHHMRQAERIKASPAWSRTS